MAYSITSKQAKTVIANVRKAIQTYFKENNLEYAIFGKSEGLDSSVIAGLLADLPGVKPIGVLLPVESSPDAERIGRIVLDHFKIPALKIDLTQEFHAILGKMYTSGNLHEQLLGAVEAYGDTAKIKQIAYLKTRANANIKVRLRMITLYHLAQLTGGIVISTDNLSELLTGFWTINGDVGDFCPIQHVWKGLEEYTIAKELGVPKESLDVPPTDGLDITPMGTDQDQLKLPYPDLDRVLISLLQNKFDGKSTWEEKKLATLCASLSKKLKLSEDSIRHAAQQMRKTDFKRRWPHILSRAELGLPAVDDIAL